MDAASFPKITVVTPNYNQGDFIERTIKSVVEQGYPNLEYIIMDGGSTDDSVDIIIKYADQLTHWESSSDKGMYDAINKGFARSTGDIMCWINSDDMLAPGSLETIASTFQKQRNLHWLMGKPTIINEKDEITWQGQNAKVYNRLYFYLHNHLRAFSFIQQESTFWSRDLWNRSGGTLSLDFDLASDFDLWLRFFHHEKPTLLDKQLAAFRRRSGQKSEAQEKYNAETLVAIKNQQKLLPSITKFKLFWFKALRLLMFSFKSKKIKNQFYELQDWLFGNPRKLKT